MDNQRVAGVEARRGRLARTLAAALAVLSLSACGTQEIEPAADLSPAAVPVPEPVQPAAITSSAASPQPLPAKAQEQQPAIPLASARPVASLSANPRALASSEPAAGAASAPLASDRSSTEPGKEQFTRLLFAGDLALSLHVGHRMESDADAVARGYPLTAVADRIRAADWAIGNLECVASRKGTLSTGHNPFRCASQSIDVVLGAGFDTVSVANNHALDFGRRAFRDMVANLRNKGLEPLGERAFYARLQPPVVRTFAGTRIGLLGYYYPPENPEKDILACRKDVDVLIIFNHWGREGRAEPLLGQRLLGRAQVDAGADLVLGTHAHVRQPSEWYRGKLIAYGLGNAVFSGMSDQKEQLQGAFLEVDIADKRIAALRMLPIELNREGEPRFSTPPDEVPNEQRIDAPPRPARERLLPPPEVWNEDR